MKYYVYIYFDSRTNGIFKYSDLEFTMEPIYVGKGCRSRYLAQKNSFLSGKKLKNKHLHEKLSEITESKNDIVVLKFLENLSEDDAYKEEEIIVEKIGRISKNTGPLCNLTSAGSGGRNKSKETLKKFSESKKGEKNPMFGKTTSLAQKESVSKAHKEGKIVISKSGRENIIKSNQKRKGIKKEKIYKHAITYKLISPTGSIFTIKGATRLQSFCKDKKLQFHILKNNLNTIITENLVKGNRIHAKNTIGWKIEY